MTAEQDQRYRLDDSLPHMQRVSPRLIPDGRLEEGVQELPEFLDISFTRNPAWAQVDEEVSPWLQLDSPQKVPGQSQNGKLRAERAQLAAIFADEPVLISKEIDPWSIIYSLKEVSRKAERARIEGRRNAEIVPLDDNRTKLPMKFILQVLSPAAIIFTEGGWPDVITKLRTATNAEALGILRNEIPHALHYWYLIRLVQYEVDNGKTFDRPRKMEQWEKDVVALGRMLYGTQWDTFAGYLKKGQVRHPVIDTIEAAKEYRRQEKAGY